MDFYISICSPNHLHLKHIKFGIDNNLNVICEKPIVLNNIQFKKLEKISIEKDRKISSILQLRNHPSLIKLKNKIKNSQKIHKVDLIYYTERDENYFKTWKGNTKKSGGIMLNIGIHFFDILIWIFGDVLEQKIFNLNNCQASGSLILKKAKIKWNLSVKSKKIKKMNNLKVYRSIKVDGKEIKFAPS